MANYTLDIDSESYQFLGIGSSSPCESKDHFGDEPFSRNIAGLPLAEQERFFAENSSYWNVVRVHICGGSFAQENREENRNYPTKIQEDFLRRFYTKHPDITTVVTPWACPSSLLPGGYQKTIRPDGVSIDVADTATLYSDHTLSLTTEDWQVWLDDIAKEIQHLIDLGANVKYFTTPNEPGIAGVQNLWQIRMPLSLIPFYIKRIWLGESLSGGGIKDRFPQIEKFILDQTAIGGPDADKVEIEAATKEDSSPLFDDDMIYGLHTYLTIDTTFFENLSIGASLNWFGKCAVTEMGRFIDQGDQVLEDKSGVRSWYRRCHAAIVYGRSPFICHWTSVRDVKTMSGDDGRGVSYTAKPQCNLADDKLSFSYTPYWWLSKPMMLAAGKGTSSPLVSDAQTSTNAIFDPATDRHLTAFRREDGTFAICLANLTDSPTTDTYTIESGEGASAKGVLMTGLRRKDFTQFTAYAPEDAESDWQSLTKTGNEFTITVPAGTVSVVEFSTL